MSDATAAAIRTLLDAVERLEREGARLERRVSALERAASRPAAPRPDHPDRLPLARAAKRLGVSRQHAYRLGERGLLDLIDAREPGAERGVWTVNEASVERFLAERDRQGRAGHPPQESSGAAGRKA